MATPSELSASSAEQCAGTGGWLAAAHVPAMAARGVNIMRINTKYDKKCVLLSQILLKCRGIVQPW